MKRWMRKQTLVGTAKRLSIATALICCGLAAPNAAWSQTTAPQTTAPQTTSDASADLPSWRLGIPTFNGGKSGAQMSAMTNQLKKASSFQLPSYIYQKRGGVSPAAGSPAGSLPAAGAPSAELASMTVPDSSTSMGVQPTNYQVDPLALSGPETAVPSMELPSVPGNGAGLPDLPLPSPSDGSPSGDTANMQSGMPSGPIGAAIASQSVPEAAPLQQQTTAWYAVPWQWLRDGWENHAEFGLDGSGGNARTLALQTGIEMKRKTDDYTLALDFDYRKATAAAGTTEDNGRFNLDYDRLFENSPWAAFGKFGMEWDQFKSFDLRLNVNGGLGYHWIRTDDTEFVTRFGAGASKEIGAVDDDWKAEAVFGLEGERQINRYNKMKAKVEYFPEWADFANYRLVTDLAWEILLDDSDNLSLKLSLTDRYDSTPQGTDRANDIYYSLLLLVKF